MQKVERRRNDLTTSPLRKLRMMKTKLNKNFILKKDESFPASSGSKQKLTVDWERENWMSRKNAGKCELDKVVIFPFSAIEYELVEVIESSRFWV